MTKRYICAIFLAVTIPVFVAAEELPDPRTRDEDISGATVTVAINKDSQGRYHYDYTITNPATSLGKILNFWLHVGCPAPVPNKGELGDLGLVTDSVSDSGNHVPVAAGGSLTFGVSASDYALWLVALTPGQTANVTLVSGYGPMDRAFRLRPFMDTEGWNYGAYSEGDPSVPWIPEFTVTGFTRGPACPGQEESIEPPRFSGTLYPNETATVNDLLTYSEPLRDRFHADADTTSLKVTIYYAKEIDPHSFRVLPEKHGLKRLFNPQPGTSETVTLPLEPGKNKIQLQVKATHLPPGKMKDEVYYNHRGPDMDQDDFEVRVGDGGVGKGPSDKAQGAK